jgi:hypothetical protein
MLTAGFQIHVPALQQQPANVKVIIVCVTPRASAITEAVARCVSNTAASWQSLIDCQTIVGCDSMNKHQKLEKQCGVLSWGNIARHRVPVQLNSVRIC